MFHTGIFTVVNFARLNYIVKWQRNVVTIVPALICSILNNYNIFGNDRLAKLRTSTQKARR